MYKIKLELPGCKTLSELNDFIKSKNIKLILFGETHGMINELPMQEEIIEEISPGFYLYELLEEDKIIDNKRAEEFLDKPDSERFSVISTFGELKSVIKLARKFNLPLIGCDTKDMLRKDRSFLEKINPPKEDMDEEERIMDQREKQQLSVIKEYLSKSQKPIFASLGLYHIRNESFLMKNLKDNFLIVFPVVKDNQKLWEAENFNPEEISYILTSKDKYFNN